MGRIGITSSISALLVVNGIKAKVIIKIVVMYVKKNIEENIKLKNRENTGNNHICGQVEISNISSYINLNQ